MFYAPVYMLGLLCGQLSEQMIAEGKLSAIEATEKCVT